MRIRSSEAGSSPSRTAPRHARAGGFTLLEILVTLVIAAMLTGLVALALPAGNEQLAHTEARRLAALLDTAREQAVAQSLPVAWAPGVDGYNFLRPSPHGWVPLLQSPLVSHAWPWVGHAVGPDYLPRMQASQWYAGAVRVRVLGGGALGAAPGWLVFGSEPVSQPMRVELDAGSVRLSVWSNGAQPFQVDEQR